MGRVSRQIAVSQRRSAERILQISNTCCTSVGLCDWRGRGYERYCFTLHGIKRVSGPESFIQAQPQQQQQLGRRWKQRQQSARTRSHQSSSGWRKTAYINSKGLLCHELCICTQSRLNLLELNILYFQYEYVNLHTVDRLVRERIQKLLDLQYIYIYIYLTERIFLLGKYF